MCTVSMVGDHYRDHWPIKWPPVFPPNQTQTWPDMTGVTREEFDALLRDVEEMKELLERAKKYDEDNHEPDCEVDEKMAILKKVADAFGVDISDVISKKV